LMAEENEALPLESSTSIDAHLGDALCQICAMVHFYVAVNESLKQIEPGTLEYSKSDGKRKYQRLARRDQIELVLFAPGGKDAKAGHYNPNFKHYCARINSAFGSPLREFPSRAILTGISLTGADLSFLIIIDTRLTSVNLSGANLSGANLYRANLSGASLKSLFLDDVSQDSMTFYTTILSGANLREASLDGADLLLAFGLTREQVESAWIDKRTRLPEEFKKVKSEILERQRLRIEQINEMESLSPGTKLKEPEQQRE
jgi:Pentapeptide repeats (8 copies)